jgi:hypothetical protein
MTDINLIIETLVADDPRRAADRLLARVADISSASGAALIEPSGGSANVVLSHRLPLANIASLTVRLADHYEELRGGRAVMEKAFALVPVQPEADLRGVVYLSEPRGIGADRLKAIVASGAAAFAAALDALPREAPAPAVRQDVKGQMVRILETNDWNIAKVSRILGVTRRTLYMRMNSFGIRRKKVPRLIKPLTVS